jgi:uncharacterized protein (TIGR02646 family)
MIRVVKPNAAPAVLDSLGRPETAADCARYTAVTASGSIGTLNFAFKNTIYNHPSVKRALMLAQHNKCCFCESKVGEDGDVEHFRPKAGYRQRSRSPLTRPGYYWLAYEWANLFLSCSACNQRHKRNYFPISDLSKRATDHNMATTQEDPLYIDPAVLDPALHITFWNESPRVVNASRCGKATIAALRLDRNILNERRRSRLQELVRMRNVLDLEVAIGASPQGRRLLKDVRRALHDAVLDDAEFAAMARSAAANDFRLRADLP